MINKSQRGRSIIEVIGVLAIASIAIALAMRTYQKNDAKVKITKTMYNISELTDSIKSIYWGKNDYDGISNTYLEGKGVDTKFLRDAYGNDLTIVADNSINGYTVQISDIKEQEQCYKFASRKIEGMEDTTSETCSTSDRTVTYTFK